MWVETKMTVITNELECNVKEMQLSASFIENNIHICYREQGQRDYVSHYHILDLNNAKAFMLNAPSLSIDINYSMYKLNH